MVVQWFMTTCEECGEELTCKVGDMTGTNKIIVDFVDGMEFYCIDCNVSTYIELEKYTS